MGKPGFFDEESVHFKEELEASEKYRQQIAMYFMERGVRLEVPVMEYRKDLADRARFKNEKDIIAWPGVADHEMCVIEVKSRKEAFKDAEDFSRVLRRKYGQTDIFVDTVHGWSQKSPKPKLICMVSCETGAMIALPGRTEDQWTSGVFGDGSRGYADNFYKADPKLFITMEQAARKILKMQEKYSPKRNEYGRIKLAERRHHSAIVSVESIVLSNTEDASKLEAIEEVLASLPH